jgi:hypothetical protein
VFVAGSEDVPFGRFVFAAHAVPWGRHAMRKVRAPPERGSTQRNEARNTAERCTGGLGDDSPGRRHGAGGLPAGHRRPRPPRWHRRPRVLSGLGGDDALAGLGATDELRGGAGDDDVYGDRCYGLYEGPNYNADSPTRAPAITFTGAAGTTTKCRAARATTPSTEATMTRRTSCGAGPVPT